mmetsp:Transcript_12507/g.44976  ORF Transcript_12507/g.44976 Transcript_12507/m.44976 type:complete len:349 (-) Transcript_12507:876-1922(-)
MTRSWSAISYSSATNVSSTCDGRPPTTETTLTSVFFTFFFFSTTGAAGAASASIFSAPPSSAAGFSASAMGSSSLAAGGAGGGSTTTSSSISSIACACSTETRPLRFKRTFTLSFVFSSASLARAMGPMSNDPIASSVPGGSSVGVVYFAWIVNVSSRKKVIIFDDGTALLRSKISSSFASPSSLAHANDTGYGNESTTSKSRTLNCGESIAPWSAHPLATHSLALSVRPGTCPKNASSCAEMNGIRDALPTSSTAAMSSGTSPASLIAVVTGPMSFSSKPWESSSIFSRVMDDLTSTSSMMHSTLMGASGLALRIFFIFSIAIFKRNDARALDLMSILCFAPNSSQK